MGLLLPNTDTGRYFVTGDTARQVRQLAKRARRVGADDRGSLFARLQRFPQILRNLWQHVLHQRIERHDVLSLGMRTVIMTVGMARDHCVLDSTLVPFWLDTMDGNSTG